MQAGARHLRCRAGQDVSLLPLSTGTLEPHPQRCGYPRMIQKGYASWCSLDFINGVRRWRTTRFKVAFQHSVPTYTIWETLTHLAVWRSQNDFWRLCNHALLKSKYKLLREEASFSFYQFVQKVLAPFQTQGSSTENKIATPTSPRRRHLCWLRYHSPSSSSAAWPSCDLRSRTTRETRVTEHRRIY